MTLGIGWDHYPPCWKNFIVHIHEKSTTYISVIKLNKYLMEYDAVYEEDENTTFVTFNDPKLYTLFVMRWS
jgi:hypothetical protein